MKKILSVVLFLTLIASILASCAKTEKPLTVAELLDLGEKYLLEMDYEQAVVQFLKVIEIEPMNPRGYTGAAEAYVGIGEIDKAIEVLQSGLNALPDNEEIRLRLEELHLFENSNIQESPEMTSPPTIIDQTIDVYQFLSDLLLDYISRGIESVYDTLDASEYQELIAYEHEYPLLYIDDATNYGVGIYTTENEVLYIYIGEYTDKQRSGNGLWLSTVATQESKYYFEGEWANDTPYGFGIENMVIGNYTLTRSGVLVNGLWDGKVNEDTIYMEEEFKTVQVYSNGKLVVLDDPLDTNNDGTLTYPTGYLQDHESYYVYSPSNMLEMTWGIGGFNMG